MTPFSRDGLSDTIHFFSYGISQNYFMTGRTERSASCDDHGPGVVDMIRTQTGRPGEFVPQDYFVLNKGARQEIRRKMFRAKTSESSRLIS